MGQRVDRVVWDTEAARMKRDEESWDEFRPNAGISLALLYAVDEDAWTWYDGSQLEAMAQRLERASEVVGYNSIGYDHVVLDAALGRRVFIANEVDLWDLIRAGLSRQWGKGAWTLDAVCGRTLGLHKEGKGAWAPQLYAEGKIGELNTYLQKDVQLTLELWKFMVRYGFVIQPDDTKLTLGVKIGA